MGRNKINTLIIAFLIILYSSGKSAELITLHGNNHESTNSENMPNAVVLIHQTRFEVKDNNSAVLNVKYKVMILNNSGRNFGNLILPYDKFHEIESLEGKIFDSTGEEIRELEDSDIKDYSDINDFSLYEDSRVKLAQLFYDRYPYTVEYEYEISYNGYISWPTWYAQESLEPVVESSFEVLIPSDMKLRYWCSKDSVSPAIEKESDIDKYTWEAKNLPKLSRDVVGDDLEDITTIVRIAPLDFEIEGQSGNFKSWKNFGQWIYSLYKGKDKLPEKLKKEIHSLADTVSDTRQKIQKLYRYLQKNTRYVSVQLGIGGWQPFDAEYVCEHSYGDCKALSNYMTALLKEVGITSYPVIIRNGNYRYPFIEEFPSNQFNHVIVCVPMQKDSIWLECTNQYMPFGLIGSGSENRKALMITPDGGVVVNTPVSSANQNTQQRKIDAALDVYGGADIKSETMWTGDQQNSIRNSISEKTPEEQKRWVMNSLDVPNLNIGNYSFKGIDEPENQIGLTAKFSAAKYGSVSGNRIFFQPNFLGKNTYVPPKVKQRLSPERFRYPYCDIDTAYINLPSGYKIEYIPNEVKLNSSFGEYNCSSKLIDKNKILYTRKIEISSYSVPAGNYDEYIKFFSSIVKADKAQVVLVK